MLDVRSRLRMVQLEVLAGILKRVIAWFVGLTGSGDASQQDFNRWNDRKRCSNNIVNKIPISRWHSMIKRNSAYILFRTSNKAIKDKSWRSFNMIIRLSRKSFIPSYQIVSCVYLVLSCVNPNISCVNSISSFLF